MNTTSDRCSAGSAAAKDERAMIQTVQVCLRTRIGPFLSLEKRLKYSNGNSAASIVATFAAARKVGKANGTPHFQQDILAQGLARVAG
jgi:hypothetical protein